MPSVTLFNQQGEKVGRLTLKDEIFGLNSDEHQQAIFETVVAQRAGMRQGTQKAKTRTEVSGGGKKPWRQKGTGRARQGSIRSPQWRGGGVVFAPTPRSHALKINKKVVKLATKCVLSQFVAEKNLVAIDQLEFADCKTKNLVQVLKNVNLEGKILVLTEERDHFVELSGRNLPNVLVLPVLHASVYDLMCSDKLLVTKAAVKKYEEVLK